LLSESLITTGFYYHKGEELSRQIAVFDRVHQKVQTIRRPGSAALDLAYVAAGYFDAFWEKGLAAWDVAAGYLLVQEAGGVVTDYQGGQARITGDSTIASNGLLHAALLEVIVDLE
jgi:myo-inositol-1(or 4)-monophosphatase